MAESIEKIEKKRFWYGQMIAMWIVASLVLPQIYFTYFIIEIALPKGIINLFSVWFPVFNQLPDPYSGFELARHENTYAMALITGVICFVASIWNIIVFEKHDLLFHENFGDTLLEKQKDMLKAKYSWIKILFVLVAAFWMPVFFLWVGLYKQIVPIFIISGALAVLQANPQYFIRLYIKRRWFDS